MNREIKFRLWKPEEKKMLTWADMRNEHTISDFPYFESACGYKLMQYTGLKDKYGKCIYEGDIVKRIGDAYTSEFCAPVKWDDDIAGFTAFKENCVDENGQFEHKDVFDYKPIVIEVIGNIYQNPELLK